MTIKKPRCFREDFMGGFTPPTSVGASRWVKTLVGDATIANASGGGCLLSLTATNEAQSATLSFGDVLSFPLPSIMAIRFLVELSADLPEEVTFVAGLASAHNTAIASIANKAWIKAVGENALTLETDDGTNEADVAAGMSLSTTPKWFTIDLETDMLTQAPPALSKGHRSNIRWSAQSYAAQGGSMKRLAPNSHFRMDAATGNVQPYFRILKTSSTAVATARVHEVEIDYGLPTL